VILYLEERLPLRGLPLRQRPLELGDPCPRRVL
jgi:hypothetical protein